MKGIPRQGTAARLAYGCILNVNGGWPARSDLMIYVTSITRPPPIPKINNQNNKYIDGHI